MLGSKAAQLAKVRGITQFELQKKTGISKSTIGRFFRGDISISLDKSIAILDALGVDLSSSVQTQLNQYYKSKDNNNFESFENNEAEQLEKLIRWFKKVNNMDSPMVNLDSRG